MPRPSKRTAILSALAIALLIFAVEPLFEVMLGTHALGWAAWVCGHSLSGSIQHFAPTGRLGVAFRTSRDAIAVHWPHLVPIAPALATLTYLHRESRRRRPGRRELPG